MTTTAVTPSASPRLDLTRLSEGIGSLMLRYCDVIEACKSIPRLSLMPLLRLYLKMLLWELCVFISPILAVIDLLRFLLGKALHRSPVMLGRTVYHYLGQPFRSIWEGEIPILAIVRMRFLTQILVFYHAQTRIRALHSAFNREHLRLIISQPPLKSASEADKFQGSFDIFGKVISEAYQLRVLAVGGPLAVLLSVAAQQGIEHGLFPLISFLWSYFGGTTLVVSSEQIGSIAAFFILFLLFAIWIVVSAWMEMRSILNSLGVPKLEREVYMEAATKYESQIPLDVLFFLVLIVLYPTCLILMSMQQSLYVGELYELLLNSTMTMIVFLGVGIVILIRRHLLLRDNSSKVRRP